MHIECLINLIKYFEKKQVTFRNCKLNIFPLAKICRWGKRLNLSPVSNQLGPGVSNQPSSGERDCPGPGQAANWGLRPFLLQMRLQQEKRPSQWLKQVCEKPDKWYFNSWFIPIYFSLIVTKAYSLKSHSRVRFLCQTSTECPLWKLRERYSYWPTFKGTGNQMIPLQEKLT